MAATDESLDDGPDGTGGPHVFVESIDAPEMVATDRHHLERVLRMRAGDILTVSDGNGWWRSCRYGAPLRPVDEPRYVAEKAPAITVAFTPVKGDRPEWVVQKLTELGVDRIIVLRSERSIVRWEGERGPRQLERLERVAREAAMQCRRCRIPAVTGVWGLEDVAALDGVVRADRGGAPPSLDHPIVAIGPEGGWTAAEREAIPHCVGLADHVLRAETAAVTAGALLTAQRGGFWPTIEADRPG
jgi:16S rRNA (uracil1498-N3)-methyltransferase